MSQGRIEKWELAVGAITQDASLRGALVVQMHCIQALRPAIQSFHFGLFYRDHGAYRRAYMIEVDVPCVGDPLSHSWPHVHFGADRREPVPLHDCPRSFEDTLKRFMSDCNITPEEPFTNPFEFQLRP